MNNFSTYLPLFIFMLAGLAFDMFLHKKLSSYQLARVEKFLIASFCISAIVFVIAYCVNSYAVGLSGQKRLIIKSALFISLVIWDFTLSSWVSHVIRVIWSGHLRPNVEYLNTKDERDEIAAALGRLTGLTAAVSGLIHADALNAIRTQMITTYKFALLSLIERHQDLIRQRDEAIQEINN